MPATAFRTAITAAILALAGMIAPAAAEVVSFTAELRPVAGTASTGSGNVSGDYDTGSKKLTWRGTYRGIGTYATSASTPTRSRGGVNPCCRSQRRQQATLSSHR